MKFLLAICRLTALCLILPACAHTVVKKNDQVILDTQANADLVEFRQGDTSLKMVKMNHSTPTRAGGSVIGTAATGATGIATAILTRGLVH